MSADDHIDALRAAGHDAAADLLERRAADQAKAELARKGPGETRPAGVKVIDDRALGIDAQSRREGESLLEGMKAAGMLKPARTVPLFGGQR